jgi:hypothetical protein
MLAFVTSEADSQLRIVAVLNAPFADVVSDGEIVTSVEISLAFRRVCIWRIKKNACKTLLDSWRFATDS